MAAKKKGKRAKKGKRTKKARKVTRRKPVARKKVSKKVRKKVAKKTRRKAAKKTSRKVAKKGAKKARKKVAKKKKVARRTKATARKKTAKVVRPPVAAVPVAPIARPSAPPVSAGEERIGVVTHYYTHLSVAVVELEPGATLHEGELIHIKGHTSDFIQPVESMEIDHVHVQEASVGQSFGLKVREHAREHDVVYRVKSF